MLRDVWSVLRRPAPALRELAARHSPPPAAVAVVVVVAGLVAAVLQVAGNAVEPYPPGTDGDTQRLAGDALSATVPLLFVAFWFFEAAIVDAAARVMGAPSERRRYRRLVALTYPVLALYAVVSLVQSLIDRAAGGSGVVDWLGVADFAVLVWFIGLAAVAAREVYRLPGLSALAAALLPYAALTAVLLVAGVALSAIQPA